MRVESPRAGAALATTLVVGFLKAERGALAYFAEPTRRTLEIVTVGVDDEMALRCRESLAGADEVRRIAESRADVVDDAGAGRLRPVGLAHALGLRSYLRLPLVGTDGAAGELVCGDEAARHWARDEIEAARQLASAGALVIEAARRAESERQARAELAYRETHDPVTGMLNREAFEGHLGGMLEQRGALLAVVLLDLDRFKPVNDTYGRRVGDELLSAVARRVERCLRREDVSARLGGDEFAAALRAPQPLHAARLVAARIAAALRQPFTVEGATVHIAATSGIAVAPDHGRSPAALLRAADEAMSLAKAREQAIAVHGEALPEALGVSGGTAAS